MKRKPFLTDPSGTTALEFALLSPVFFMLLTGILEFSIIMFVLSVMENATSSTSRLGKTGYVQDGISRSQELINNVVTLTSPLLTASKVTVNTLVYSNLNQIGQPEPCITAKCGAGVAGVDYTDVNGNGHWDADMGASGDGNAGDYVVYTVNYPWQVMTPVISNIIGHGGVMNLQARAVVRNEPYAVN